MLYNLVKGISLKCQECFRKIGEMQLLTRAKRSNSIGTSLIFHESEGHNVPTFKQLREEAGLTAFDLAAKADVSLSTVNRMEYGTTQVSRRMAYKVLNVISKEIGRRVSIEEVEGLKIKQL